MDNSALKAWMQRRVVCNKHKVFVRIDSGESSTGISGALIAHSKGDALSASREARRCDKSVEDDVACALQKEVQLLLGRWK